MTSALNIAWARIAHLRQQRLARNVGWYGAAELAARITRIATTVLVARVTARTELGCAAAALTAFELFRVLTNAGFGQTVVAAAEARLAGVCATAHRAVWAVCLSVAAAQAGAGAALYAAGRQETGAMLAVLSLVYLVMAPGLVPVYRIQRANRLPLLARIATLQMVADNLLTFGLAALGLGGWALVLPKLLVAPIWLIGVRRSEAWRFSANVARAPYGEVLRFALPVLGTEIINAARLNLDNLLVGAILGMEALGTYFFVFNAGIGLSLALTTALCNALFPHLAEGTPGRTKILARFDHALLTAVLPVSCVIALQAAASLIYVPFIFGARWHDAAPLVAMLCASATARPFADAGCQLLRACGRTGQDFATTLGMTCLYLGGFALALPRGLGFAIPVLACTALVLQMSTAAAARLSLQPAHRLHPA